MDYTTKIQILFNSGLTSYKIGQDCGLSAQYVDNYRSGKSKIENMALGKAEILVKYAEEEIKMETLKGYITTDYNDETCFWYEGDAYNGYWDDETQEWVADENSDWLVVEYFERTNRKTEAFEYFEKAELVVIKELDVLNEQSDWQSADKGIGYHDKLVKNLLDDTEYVMTTSQWEHDQKIKLV